MNTRAFSLSLVIAGMAMFMVYSYMESREGQFIEKYQQEQPVVVAKVDISELETIDDSKLEIASIPQSFIAPNAFRNIKELENTIAIVPILKGEQITSPRVTYPGTRTGLSRQVSVGKRAYAITVNNSQSVGNLIRPGDRVDVVASIDYSGGRRDLQRVITVLQDVLVLSTGLSITNEVPLVRRKDADNNVQLVKLSTYTDYNTVTLELDPFQVQKMEHIRTLGGVPVLSLRNNGDSKIVRIKSSRIYDILGESAGEAKEFFNNLNSAK